MSGINSASVVAGPIFQSSEPGLVIMAGSLYIHQLTPAVAKQWLPIIQAIAGGGGMARAFDDGFTACANEHAKQRHDPTHPITRINPYKEKSN